MRADAAAARDAALVSWIEREVGGRVVRVVPMSRWRMAWDLDVEVDGRLLELHARAEREANFAIPLRLADEAPLHDLLEAHGLPVPHVYGLCPEPLALVMDRLPGHVDLSFADSDDERESLLDQYLELLPAIYAIPLPDAQAAGLSVPTTPREIQLAPLVRHERIYDSLMPGPDPVAVFLRRWLHDNAPEHRDRAVFVTHDAFQFMFGDGRLTGLLDFELSIVGDPMMDLGALRVRDTIKSLGDLVSIGERFAAVTGWELDHDAIEYHTVLYNSLTVLAAGPPLLAPEPTTDYVSHLAWYVNSARWALESIAEIRGYTLDTVTPPVPTPAEPAAFGHLVATLSTLNAEPQDAYSAWCARQLARHLERLDAVGAQLSADDLDDASALVGRRLDPDDLDDALAAHVATDDDEEAIVRTLDRMVQRRHLGMGRDDSLMLRHPALRSLRPERRDDASTESWPAGAIPGTA